MCRGFGFVTFVNPTSVDKVLAAGVHQLDAKVVSRPSTSYRNQVHNFQANEQNQYTGRRLKEIRSHCILCELELFSAVFNSVCTFSHWRFIVFNVLISKDSHRSRCQ